jgi:hypothetical protein
MAKLTKLIDAFNGGELHELMMFFSSRPSVIKAVKTWMCTPEYLRLSPNDMYDYLLKIQESRNK